jgi:hypothetical protein
MLFIEIENNIIKIKGACQSPFLTFTYKIKKYEKSIRNSLFKISKRIN